MAQEWDEHGNSVAAAPQQEWDEQGNPIAASVTPAVAQAKPPAQPAAQTMPTGTYQVAKGGPLVYGQASPTVNALGGAVKTFGVDPMVGMQHPDTIWGKLGAVKEGLGQAASSAWKGVKGEMSGLAEHLGEGNATPFLGTPFTNILAIPDITARMYEGISSNLEGAGATIHKGIQNNDPRAIAAGVGQVVGALGQAHMMEQADTAWKFGAKQQLLDTVAKVRAEGAKHFSAISQADAAANQMQQVAGTHNIVGYINDLTQKINDRATAPSIRLQGTMEGLRTLNDMLNRQGPNQGNPLLNFDEMVRVRSRIGEELGKARRLDKAEGLGTAKSLDSQLLSELYGKMSNDMEGRAQQLGMGKSWTAGNGRFSELHTILDQTPVGDALKSPTGKQFFDALDSSEYGGQIRNIMSDWKAYGLDERFHSLLKETRGLRRMASSPEPGMPIQKRLGTAGLFAMAGIPRPFLTAYAGLMVKNALFNTFGDPAAWASGKLDEMAGVEGPRQMGPTPVSTPRPPQAGGMPQGEPTPFTGPEQRVGQTGPNLGRRLLDDPAIAKAAGSGAQETPVYDDIRAEVARKIAEAKTARGRAPHPPLKQGRQ